ncbi:MAG: glycosyl hydrolase [Cytophagales bacterium]|nr:glycosyl hydrolase [Cytophagales bacterium]
MRFKSNLSKTVSFLIILLLSCTIQAQTPDKAAIERAAAGMKLRGIGPSLMGGRIADIAIHPSDLSTWYVAVGSGNLWKTTNRGITWTPIFENQSTYSIGTVTIDPNNPNVIWVGTGENVSGRHVGWGDGIYKSTDAGKTWKNMGLNKSEHIGKILVDPRNSDVILVAAEGPLWSAGGERGLYKSIDGGQSWKLVLQIDQYTGVTDIEFNPKNPNVVYAAAYQRFRRTWALMAGGPNSGIYKSTNNGESFNKITTGLPSGDMGKIGLAVTPADPNLVYATIEANDQEKGFYRSTDQGSSWEKRNSYISGGTGPHYYQELEASLHDPDLVYQMDVFLHITKDGGKTIDYLGNGREKHSDNHALWIDPTNGDHMIAGSDGGLYETFDGGSFWRHFANLPISQFYKLGLDNSEPFYNIVGGAQDLGTLIGPSRTTSVEGILSSDWYVPLGADGYGSLFDPEDNNTAYMETQQGNLQRLNVATGELIGIRPQPALDEAPERWNWDSPIHISPHDHNRIYFGSQRLWQSNNRGDAWEAISKDLTTNTNRYELELMDRVWSVDALYDNGAMSKYATLTTISESPKVAGLLYTGSDDGLVHVSEDGGQNWRKSNLPKGVPARSFINDIEASPLEDNVVFTVVDAHKFGDYAPYIFMSADRGKTWRSISGDLPSGTIVWAIKQDHVASNLLFIGAEDGMYFSYNKGANWVKLKGAPTIPFRDITTHTRDNDLVGATFGRGFYILDDYSPLRNLSQAVTGNTNTLFAVRDAWWYVPTVPFQAKGMPGQGSAHYVAENPDFGAMISYYLSDVPQNLADQRKDREKEIKKGNGNVPFPGWENLNEERKGTTPQVLILIKEEAGNAVRWLEGKSAKGLHRINWDLKLPAPDAIQLTKPAFQPPWAGDAEGPLAAPGTYSAQLYIEDNGHLTPQGDAQSFEVKPIPSLEQVDFKQVAAFQQETRELLVEISGLGGKLSEAGERLRFIKAALKQTPKAQESHFQQWNELNSTLADLRMVLYGDPARGSLDESRQPGISGRVGTVAYSHWGTTNLPTETMKEQIKTANESLQGFKVQLKEYLESFKVYEAELTAIGAPYTRGRRD